MNYRETYKTALKTKRISTQPKTNDSRLTMLDVYDIIASNWARQAEARSKNKA